MSEIITTLMSTAYVLPYTTADPTQFSAITGSVSVSYPPKRSSYTFDLKLKHICDHVLSSGIFKLANCPRCLGNGYYYDVKLMPDGQFEIIIKASKLQQELEKIILSERNPFHPKYGASLISRVGSVSMEDIKGIVKRDLVDAIMRLKFLQDSQYAFSALSPDERVSRIESISVEENGTTGLQFQIVLITKSALKYAFDGEVVFNE